MLNRRRSESNRDVPHEHAEIANIAPHAKDSNSMFRWILVISLALAAGCAVQNGSQHPRKSAEVKAVEFLKREVPAWSHENGCYSCHNNGDGARALYVASKKGYQLSPEVMADTTAWLAQPARWDHNKGDPRCSGKR